MYDDTSSAEIQILSPEEEFELQLRREKQLRLEEYDWARGKSEDALSQDELEAAMAALALLGMDDEDETAPLWLN